MALSNETIIITGAAGNLGSVVARTLALRGARVICADRTERAFHTGHDGIDPDRILWCSGHDLADKAAMDAVVAAAVARFGKVTGLVNTVGGFAVGRVTAEALDQWDHLMRLNARVALVTSAAVLPAMQAAGHGTHRAHRGATGHQGGGGAGGLRRVQSRRDPAGGVNRRRTSR